MKISPAPVRSATQQTKIASAIAAAILATGLVLSFSFSFSQPAFSQPPGSTAPASVLPSKGTATVQQLTTQVKAPGAPKSDQAAVEAKINAAVGNDGQANPGAPASPVLVPSSASTPAPIASHLSLFPASSAPSSAVSTSAAQPVSATAGSTASKVLAQELTGSSLAPASSSPASSASAPASASSSAHPASVLAGASGIPFLPPDTPATNTVLRANNVQAEANYQKAAFELDKIIQARKDFAQVSTEPKVAPGSHPESQGFGRLAEPGSKINNLASSQGASSGASGAAGASSGVGSVDHLNFRVTSIATFGKHQSVEMTLPDGTDTVASPGDKIPVRSGSGSLVVKVGSVHDGGVDLLYGKTRQFYPVVAGTPDLGSPAGSGPGAARSPQPMAIPASSPPAQAPMALPPIPQAGGSSN